MAQPIDPRWAWQRYRPSAAAPWDIKRVGHLYRRTSFGATWDELEAGLRDGPDKCIERLLNGGPGLEDFEQAQAPAAQIIARGNNGQLARAWWVKRMLGTPHPLREKLALFWHNHFATSNAKVNNASFMLRQYELMYRHALGSFRTLLLDMGKDPAMMVWLDTNTSKKGMPNENYARELMELFSLGIGNYTEQDIREASRAFTGWEIKDGKVVLNESQHDDGDKTVLGKTGKWTGDDIARICLEQKSAPYFIVGKLYRFLISETVPVTTELLTPLAEQFRASDYNFGQLVETMLRSNLFFSPTVYRTRVKSPVDFVLGIVRPLMRPDSVSNQPRPAELASALDQLGQNLFNPPSVKGWDGGQAWLNAQTLLNRNNLALALTSTEDSRFRDATDPARIAEKHGKKTDTELVEFFLRLFLQNDVSQETRAKLLHYVQAPNRPVPVYWDAKRAADYRVQTLCHVVLTLPEFQLD
jgi:uncharacterized protein (DUF1800 family)